MDGCLQFEHLYDFLCDRASYSRVSVFICRSGMEALFARAWSEGWSAVRYAYEALFTPCLIGAQSGELDAGGADTP